MTRVIKIPYGLASAICAEREISDKGYHVNRIIRAVDLFLSLKSISHYIHYYRTQLADLKEVCKVESDATFYNRLWLARDLGLLKIIDKKHIVLASYETLSNIAGYRHTNQFYNIPYERTNYAHTIQHVLKGLEFQENAQRQMYAISKRLAAHPEIEAAFIQYCRRENIQAEFSLSNHLAARVQAFASGTDSNLYDELQAFNGCVRRNIKTIARAHGYRSWQAAAYMKSALFTRGIIDVTRNTAAKCHFNITKARKTDKKGSGKHGRFYNKKHNTALWFLPDEITVNSILLNTQNIAQTQARGAA